MTCPKCRLVNPPSAARCDCGYDFERGIVAESYLSAKQQIANQAGRVVDWRASGRAFGAAGVFAAALIGLARVNGPTGVIGVATYILGLLAFGAAAVGGLLLAWRSMRAEAGLLVAIGCGAWVGLYAMLWAVL